MGCPSSFQWVAVLSSAMQLLVLTRLAWLVAWLAGRFYFFNLQVDVGCLSVYFLVNYSLFLMLFKIVPLLDLEEFLSSVHRMLIQR